MKGNKINWQDLAAELAASAGIPRKDAEAFVRTFFDVLGKGVLADKSVKVKALGTFKLVEVQGGLLEVNMRKLEALTEQVKMGKDKV